MYVIFGLNLRIIPEIYAIKAGGLHIVHIVFHHIVSLGYGDWFVEVFYGHIMTVTLPLHQISLHLVLYYTFVDLYLD